MAGGIDYLLKPVGREQLVDSLSKALKTLEEREAAVRYQHELQDAMTPEEKEVFDREFVEDHYRILAAIDEDINAWKAEAIRRKLGDAPRFINWTQIATTYFGKSLSWLMQRLNGNKVNGKEASFNEAEIRQLQDALHDVGRQLMAIAL